MLTLRQKRILSYLVQDFIDRKKPVSSSRLKQGYELDFCPATIRNELYKLEKKGFLTQPHTSAGRVPTDEGYRFYVNEAVDIDSLSKTARKKIESQVNKIKDTQDKIRLARLLAELGQNLALCDLKGGEVYYWGLPLLFSKPEFDKEEIVKAARLLDRIRTDYEKLLSLADTKSPQIYIGAESMLTESLDAALIIASLSEKDKRFLALFGPKRMDYEYNLSLMDYVIRLLEK